ncbi:endolytic transglycosylase MltG [Candidatus Saccharibacteria bacterium]|nr:endolytic transglycosylase MltG [Candidatus Saccharibacteria bacterium]
MSYRMHGSERSGARGVWRIVGSLITLIVIAVGIIGFMMWRDYQSGLKPVGGSGTTAVTIEQGESVPNIAAKLKAAGLIRSTRSFEYYARFHKASQYLQAGEYEISPSQGVADIITQLTHGKVATSLVTILPGQRLDQIRKSLIEQGFSESDVDAALQPTQYENNPLFAGKPAGASLEGYLYPDSYQRTAQTKVADIIDQSIARLQKELTPSVRQGLEKQGLTTYQGITLASVVEGEVSNQSERAQAAQVFLKRIREGMPLGSDVTVFYGSVMAGKGRDITYDSPYNSRLHTGLPPTPVSNISVSSLQAVANPASTDWLYFVSGDDGITRFSRTLAEHEALTAKYCHELCLQ